jgi:hypothetical protein
MKASLAIRHCLRRARGLSQSLQSAFFPLRRGVLLPKQRRLLMGARLVIRHSGFVIAFLLAACTNEGAIYVKKHPELNPEQRRIIASGKIPDGTAVAGLTRDQIRIAMGTDPYTIDRSGDEDIWVFSRKKAVAKDPEFAKTPADAVLDKTHGYSETDTDENAPRVDMDVKTTVYFDGNIATHARTIEEKAQ